MAHLQFIMPLAQNNKPSELLQTITNQGG